MTKQDALEVFSTCVNHMLSPKGLVDLQAVAMSGGFDHQVHEVHEAVNFASKAAEEARREVLDSTEGDRKQANIAASEAFKNNLPELSHIINVRLFIAVVAAGVKRGYIAAPDARLLLYTAQLQLAAMTKRVQ